MNNDKEYLQWSLIDCWHELDNIVIRGVNDINEAEFAIKKLKEVVTPPTEKEVCKALNEHLKGEIIYDWENKRFEFEIDGTEVVRMTWRGTVRLNSSFPPHLIVLIGRFYEGP